MWGKSGIAHPQPSPYFSYVTTRQQKKSRYTNLGTKPRNCVVLSDRVCRLSPSHCQYPLPWGAASTQGTHLLLYEHFRRKRRSKATWRAVPDPARHVNWPLSHPPHNPPHLWRHANDMMLGQSCLRNADDILQTVCCREFKLPDSSNVSNGEAA